LGSTKTKKIDEKEFNKIYRRAEKAEKREDYETELLLLDQLLKADPYDYEILNKKGLAQFRLGKTKDAMESFRQSIRYCSSDVAPYANIALVFLSQRRLDESIKYYDIALHRDPTVIQAWHNKGEALKLKKRFEDAIACYEKAISLNPAYYMSYVAMADALSRLGRVEESQQYMKKAVQLNSEYAMRWMLSNLVNEDLVEPSNMEARMY
jgi:tetratricopeptide (TPR) repeat protein